MVIMVQFCQEMCVFFFKCTAVGRKKSSVVLGLNLKLREMRT